MPSICICLADNPILSVFAFKPGERVNVHVSFENDLIPGRYRLQILDHKQNSRLNRYGKGLSDILVNNWPIPTAIRDEHLGIWQVKVDSVKNIREVRKAGREIGQSLSFSQIFFVEKSVRVEFPLLGGDIIYQLPELVPIVEEEIISEISPLETVIEVKEEVDVSTLDSEVITAISVIKVRGIGQTYANRLAKISVLTVSDLWNYKNRIYLAEVMRISDKRLEKMLEDAELLLSEKAEEIGQKDIKKDEDFIPDDLQVIKGITPAFVKKLKKIGIKSKTDLLDFKDVDLIKKILDISTNELGEILAPIGRIIEPDMIIKPEVIPPLNQPVINLKGIGKVTEGKINTVGIFTVQELLDSTFELLSGITTKKTYLKWMRSASDFTDIPISEDSETLDETKPSKGLLSLPGIGPKTLVKLNNLGIFSIEDILTFTESEQLRKALRMSISRFNDFIKKISSES